MLWNNNDLAAPVHKFYGPDMILDLAWRQSPDTNRCQLVTWSKDLALRLQEISLQLQERCGLVLDEEDLLDKLEEGGGGEAGGCQPATEALHAESEENQVKTR